MRESNYDGESKECRGEEKDRVKRTAAIDPTLPHKLCMGDIL